MYSGKFGSKTTLTDCPLKGIDCHGAGSFTVSNPWNVWAVWSSFHAMSSVGETILNGT